ncbi:MAG TPA: hypothetical protein EYQ50_26420 [Verrucomicrobiales bacterium]|nr:hypothetical protein [Verrucomicrobiales bacterium]
MTINLRYTLRVSTNIALFIFLCFSIGALLWVSDEFLGWNLLPDWIDAYAQLIIVAIGFAAGLAIATSGMCGFALLAEAAAKRADIQDYRTTRKTWKFGGVLIGMAFVALLSLNQLDNYRKKAAFEKARASYRIQYFQTVQELNLATPRIIAIFTSDLIEATLLATVMEKHPALTTFLSAVRSSTSFRPNVSLLVRAAAPYRYCLLKLLESNDRDNYGNPRNREENARRYHIEKQFYIGFPTQRETALIEELFSGTTPPLESRLEGEIIDNQSPGSWGILKSDDEVIGLLILQTDTHSRYDFFHAGPAVSSGVPDVFKTNN